jgi:hypothetical protein
LGTRRSDLRTIIAVATVCAFPVLSSGCDFGKKESSATGDASAAAVASSARAPSVPDRFDRRYSGTIGPDLKASMHLVRNGEKLSGTYAYARVGRDLALSGTVTTSGVVSMHESVDGKTSGEFKGTIATDGALTGTWSTPTGDKKLPFVFKESSEAPSAPSAPTTGAVGIPIAPLPDPGVVDFLAKLAATSNVSVPREAINSAVEGRAKFNNSELGNLALKLNLPLDSGGSFMRVYLADIDNDGAADFVVTDKNPVGLHNSRIEAVYAVNGDKLTAKRPPGHPAIQEPYYLDDPFLERVGTQVTMNFTEAVRSSRARYVWKGNSVTLLDRR